ncbi:glycosyltransferase family 2 protein [Patulibacter americanus]|uniref:glycosyltransferase family 2 protein n=1 Tax=Patulibacter americanus TaxID=588672 RepID=UPI000403C8EA|nr:glycosyltransferase family 2 protein [Patulibacter americanus]
MLILIPALNEEATVGGVIARVQGAGFDACVIDDGCTDRTAHVARSAGAAVLSLPSNLGVGGALRCGFRYALLNGYDTVVQVDADDQHDPAAIDRLLATMDETGADMVVGSRFLDGRGSFAVSRTRRVAMRVLAWRVRAALGTPITDASSGFRAIGPRLLMRFASDYPTEYLGDTVEALVIAGREGATVVECAVEMAPRTAGVASAGVVASTWYVLRVLLAVELMPRRARGGSHTALTPQGGSR